MFSPVSERGASAALTVGMNLSVAVGLSAGLLGSGITTVSRFKPRMTRKPGIAFSKEAAPWAVIFVFQT